MTLPEKIVKCTLLYAPPTVFQFGCFQVGWCWLALCSPFSPALPSLTGRIRNTVEFEEDDENDTSVLSLGLFPGEYIEYAGQ